MTKNLKLETILTIAKKYDPDFWAYISKCNESELNMAECSTYARSLRDDPTSRPQIKG